MNLTEFFNMGGYAGYVWGSYGVTALFMIIEIILVIRRRRTVLKRLSRMVSMSKNGESNESET